MASVMQSLTKFVPQRWRKGAALVPVVRLSGTIGAVTPLRPGMSLAGVAKILERAFAMKNAKAVAVVINSPVLASHTRAVLSPLAVTTRVPSGLKAALTTWA